MVEMNRTREQWAAVKPRAFLGGSIVQAANVIEMMQQDIARLYEKLDRQSSDRPVTEKGK